MRIALVAPHPVPLALGGAENLVWGLQRAFEAAGCDCDVVGQISPERNLPEVLSSYRAFLDLDLRGYDRVISGKYPAWMIGHPDHRVYMLHRLRGLYDTYPGDVAGEGALSPLPAVAAVQALMRSLDRPGPDDAREVLDRLEALARTDLPPSVLAYPGPLAREAVHFLDRVGLSPDRVRDFSAISRTVASRAGYFPDGVHAQVLHPPPHRSDHRPGGDEYLFTSSRLDRPKRLDLLIAAMRRLKADIPLLIAGTGPDRERLQALAAGDDRIRLLGFVADEAMPALYADALCVPFVPFDEDYGLVTVEAMRSSTPVVTATDSGGPLEFVRDGETGLVCAPEPDELAAALDRLVRDRAGARAMGEAARIAVSGVTWEAVVAGLLRPPPPRRPARARRRKLVVATTFPVAPPRGGGQARVFHIYRHMARTVDIDIVSFGPQAGGDSETEIAPGLVEIRVAKSPDHARFEHRLMAAAGGIPVEDVAMPRLAPFTPAYREMLARAARGAHAVIACHPYLLHELEAAAPHLALWHEAQDVEQSLKRASFAGAPGSERLLDEVAAVEGACWSKSKLVFGCTAADLDEMARLYGARRGPTVEVPNGVCLDEVRYTPPAERARLREGFGFGRRAAALFIGSWHPPNIRAVEDLLALAPGLPDVDVLVAGSVGDALGEVEPPGNVRLLGLVTPAMRDALLSCVDVALNPMTFGSGSNLKMLDYFAAGVPVVSTPFGARGFPVEHGRHAVLAGMDGFANALRDLVRDEDLRRSLSVEARSLAETRFGWNAIAATFMASLETRGLMA